MKRFSSKLGSLYARIYGQYQSPLKKYGRENRISWMSHKHKPRIEETRLQPRNSDTFNTEVAVTTKSYDSTNVGRVLTKLLLGYVEFCI